MGGLMTQRLERFGSPGTSGKATSTKTRFRVLRVHPMVRQPLRSTARGSRFSVALDNRDPL